MKELPLSMSSTLKRSLKGLVLMVGAMVLAACESTPDYDEPRNLVDFDSTGKIKRAWSRSIGSGQSESGAPLQMAIAPGRIYAAGYDGDVAAFDKDSGKRLWRVDVDAELTAGVGLGDGLIAVGTKEGEVIVVTDSDGTELWRVSLDSESLVPPAIANGLVIVQQINGQVVALKQADGTEVWRYESKIPKLTIRGTASPVVVGDVVLIGLATGKLVALNTGNGQPRWESRVAIPRGKTELDRIVDIDATPLMHGDIILAVSYQGRITALNRGTGRPLWQREASSNYNIAKDSDQVYVTDPIGVVKAFRLANGEQMWENDQMLYRNVGGPQEIDGAIAVVDYDGYLHLLSPEDGRFIARKNIGEATAPMLSDYQYLFVQTDDGDLEAYTVEVD